MANSLNSGDVKQAVNRQLFLANSIKHGIAKAAGVATGLVMNLGFGFPVVTSVMGGLIADDAVVTGTDLIIMPLWGTGKVTDRAYAQLQGK